MLKETVQIKNPSGLHARPASDLTRCAGNFESNITILYGKNRIDAKSIINILSAGIQAGSVVEFQIEGPDKQDAMKAILELADNNFGE